MRNRRGLTLLEAAIAMAIVGLVAVATLSEFATELRVGTRSADARVMQALAQDRISSLLIAPTDELLRLPDSLAAGVFPPPFGNYRWSLDVRPDRNLEGLFEVHVVVQSRRTGVPFATRIFRQPARVGRSRR